MDRRSARADADALQQQLGALGTPERAEREKRYLRSDLEFLGTSLWQTQAVVEEWCAARPVLSHEELVAMVEELWARPIHESRAAAVMLLERYRRLLGLDDVALLERLLRTSRTWALVDGLAGDVASELADRLGDAVTPTLDRWASDGDFWLRRASLLAELRPLRNGYDFGRFARHADTMLDEKEFFIRKAIGWVLRETAKHRPQEVIAFLAPRTQRASGVTMREAVRWLPGDDRERLMAAYRQKRAS